MGSNVRTWYLSTENMVLYIKMFKKITMNRNINMDLLFILIGIIALIVGLTWKKPSYGGGVVHKYAAIIIGTLFVIYGVISLF